jgi:tetratricopeptide (TPR) repeat protein
MVEKDEFSTSKVYEGEIELPTYIIRGENPNPVFRSQYGVAMIYPYTLLDDIDSHPTPKKYKILYLENAYLRVGVIPELGGRVYSVFDKITKRDVFYRNKVVKFSPLAIRGAFFSGGIEFNFPVAHAPTTADPVNWSIRQNSDGSASISFGGIEHISRMRWIVTLTLYPGRCALAQDVCLSNPYFLPGRYHYWTNASLVANDQTEFIYPLRRVRSYEFAGTSPWPYGRLDLISQDEGLPGMEGTPKWPVEVMHEPFNFRWQKNILTHVSIFGRDVKWNFFGAWQHSENYGYAHYADHHDVAGMKLWSWGNAPIGVVNQSALTDDGSLYAETQCGAMETQLDFDFLSPFQTKNWREWWIPLRGIHGLACASQDVAVNLRLNPLENNDEYELLVGVCPVYKINKAVVKVFTSRDKFVDEVVLISPENPIVLSRRVNPKKIGKEPIVTQILNPEGRILLEYTFDRECERTLETSDKKDQDLPTNGHHYYQGVYYEKLDQRDQAIFHYQKALEESSHEADAHFRLGLIYLRAADFSNASHHLQKALRNSYRDAEYFLGFNYLMENHYQQALQYLGNVSTESAYIVPAKIAQVSLHVRLGNLERAIGILEGLVQTGLKISTIHTLLAILYRKTQKPKEAIELLQQVLNTDPLCHAVLRELSILTEDRTISKLLDRYLKDDPQYILDLACFYLGFGLIEDSLEILAKYKAIFSYPMVGYLGWWISHSTGDSEKAREWYQFVLTCKPDLCFPSRLEEILALTAFLEQFPNDPFAQYYLGNFLYAHQRYDEAIRLWEQASAKMKTFDVIFRNLGWAKWKYQKDHQKAVEYFEYALSLNPLNQDLYLHLDDLYKQFNQKEKRENLLQKIISLPHLREDVRKRRVLMLVELGHEDEAIQIMTNEEFVPLEMDQTFHDVYVQAYLQRAERHINAGLTEQAIADYQKALEYPINLGVGQPPGLKQARIYYLLGLAYEAIGQYRNALKAWHSAAREFHPRQSENYLYVEKALDKINRYSEIGLELS